MIKIPPHNETYEKIVIGSAIINTKLIPKLLKCDEDYFFVKKAKDIFNLIKDMRLTNVDIDAVMVLEKLKTPELQLWFLEAQKSVQTTSTFDYYIGQLKDLYLRRKILRAGMTLQEIENKTPDEIIDEVKNYIHQISEASNPDKTKIERLKEILAEYRGLKERGNDMMMGFSTIDDMTNGLRRKRMYVLGGATGSGKTGIALNILDNVVFRCDKKVLLFSLEMSDFDIYGRLISVHKGIPSWKIQKPWYLEPADLVKMELSIESLSNDKMLIVDMIKSVGDMVDKINTHKPDLVIVDHLQYLTLGQTNKKYEEEHKVIKNNIKILRDLAVKNDFCLFLLSQVKRPERQKKQTPCLTDYQGSSGIEQQADIGMIIYYPDELQRNIFELHIVKNRNGVVGKTKIAFDSDNLKYTELYYDDEVDSPDNERGGKSDDVPF